MNPQPSNSTGAKPNRKKAFLVGDAVPKPLGFTAFPPEWLFYWGRLAPPRHSGPGSAARVASLRCPILRPGEISINRGAPKEDSKKILQKLVPAR